MCRPPPSSKIQFHTYTFWPKIASILYTSALVAICGHVRVQTCAKHVRVQVCRLMCASVHVCKKVCANMSQVSGFSATFCAKHFISANVSTNTSTVKCVACHKRSNTRNPHTYGTFVQNTCILQLACPQKYWHLLVKILDETCIFVK